MDLRLIHVKAFQSETGAFTWCFLLFEFQVSFIEWPSLCLEKSMPLIGLDTDGGRICSKQVLALLFLTLRGIASPLYMIPGLSLLRMILLLFFRCEDIKPL
jgi:hypothetical protein